jgi:hypothetical protein
MKNTQATAVVSSSLPRLLRGCVPGAQQVPGLVAMKVLRRLIVLLAVWFFGCPACIVSAQTVQYLSTVFTNRSPCNPEPCLLSCWKAIVPQSQTLTYTVELSTNCLSWQEATSPITLTQSTTIDVWTTADTRVGFVRLRIIQ